MREMLDQVVGSSWSSQLRKDPLGGVGFLGPRARSAGSPPPVFKVA